MMDAIVETLSLRYAKLERRLVEMGELKARMTGTQGALGGISRRIDRIDTRLGGIERALDRREDLR
jgi:hypothetical protein